MAERSSKTEVRKTAGAVLIVSDDILTQSDYVFNGGKVVVIFFSFLVLGILVVIGF